MKKLFSLMCLLSIAFISVQAQETEAPAPVQKEKSKSSDHFVYSLTFDNLFHKETDGFKTRWHSRGTSITFFYDMPIKNSYFSFAPGLGFTHSSYYHNSFMVEDSLTTDFNPIADFKDDEDFKRHKLATNYLEIPVELRWYSRADKADRHWKVAVGMKLGLKLTAVNKEVRKENGYFKKFKTKGYSDVNILRAGPTLRVGYGALNLSAFYSLTNLFKKNQGPEMNAFSLGLSISLL